MDIYSVLCNAGEVYERLTVGFISFDCCVDELTMQILTGHLLSNSTSRARSETFFPLIMSVNILYVFHGHAVTNTCVL